MSDLINTQDAIKNAYYDGYDDGYNAGFEAGQRDIMLQKTQLSGEDTVSRQAVIAVFGDVHPLDYNAQAYLSKIKALPSVQSEQHWILCSQRLPDREMPVWVSMCDDDVLKAIWRNGWCEPNGYKVGLTDGQVIAWMPRQTEPKPYREEGDQDD